MVTCDPTVRNWRTASKRPVKLGQTWKNRVCPYCAVIMTKAPGTDSSRTEEHLLPKGLTGGRTYDFLACQKCNNEKSKCDATLVSVARMGSWSQHLKAGFNKMLRSGEGQKSLVAFMRNFDLQGRRERPDGDYAIEFNDVPILAFLRWLRWVVRGAYFLETGLCLKTRDQHRGGGYFIRPTLLFIDNIDKLPTRRQRRHARRVVKESLCHHQLQTFADRSVHFLCTSTAAGVRIFLGKEYLLRVAVVPYKEEDFLKAINEQLDYLGSLAPDIQGKRAVSAQGGAVTLA